MRGVIVLLLLVVANTTHALELRDLWRRPDQQGMDLLDDDKPSEAAQAFDDSRWKGVSHYRAGNFDEAAKAFGQSDEQRYNQATSAVRGGDYQSAIEQFEQLLEQNPDHADARHNLDIARQLAGQDAEQEQAGQSGEQDKPADQQESDEEGENQSQPAEQDGEGEQQDSSSSQDQQQSGEQDGEQSQTADDPAQSEETADGEQQAQENDAGESGSADAQDEEEARQQVAAAEDPLSEVDQATEQWLRRIPDDPSQLLRGKIQLKHRTDYRDVGDMVEPW